MSGEQLVVVRPADLLRDERQNVDEEVERTVAREQRGDRVVVEKARERRERRLQAVGELRPVRHATAGTDVEHGFETARLVDEMTIGRSRRSGRRDLR